MCIMKQKEKLPLAVGTENGGTHTQNETIFYIDSDGYFTQDFFNFFSLLITI